MISTEEGMFSVSRAHPLNAPFPIFFNFEAESNKSLFTLEFANASSPISSTDAGIAI